MPTRVSRAPHTPQNGSCEVAKRLPRTGIPASVSRGSGLLFTIARPLFSRPAKRRGPGPAHKATPANYTITMAKRLIYIDLATRNNTPLERACQPITRIPEGRHIHRKRRLLRRGVGNRPVPRGCPSTRPVLRFFSSPAPKCPPYRGLCGTTAHRVPSERACFRPVYSALRA